MKVSVPQSILLSLLARGSIAAVSSEADNDITHLASAIKSVRITVDDNLTIESATPFLAVKATMPITPESEIVVKESGSVLVNAKDLCTWVEKQNDCRITLSLNALVSDPAADNSSDIARKIGTLSLISKDEHKTGSKWSMEAFDPAGMIKTKNGANIVPLFNITVPNLYAAIKNTEFSCNEKDDARMFNCISFQNANGDPYFVCTDTCRCAMYKMTDLMTNASDFIKNGDSRMLIPAKTFYDVVDAIRDGKDITVTYDVDRDGLLLSTTDGFVARIAMPEKAMFANFPSVVSLLQKNYEVIGTVKRTRLINRMNTLAMISKMSCLFDVKGSVLRAYVSPDCPGKSAATCTCELENPLHDGRYVWSIQHLMDIFKAVADEMVPIQVDAASNTFKVTSEKDKNVIFFGMHIDSPKYAKITLD